MGSFFQAHMSRMMDMPSPGPVFTTEHWISAPLKYLLSRVLKRVPKTREWSIAETERSDLYVYAADLAIKLLRCWVEDTGWTDFAARECRAPSNAMREMLTERVVALLAIAAESDTTAMVSLENGLLGLSAGYIAVGDRISLARGSEYALVVRACPDGYHQLRGLACVEGIMQRELEVIFEPFDAQDEELVLVYLTVCDSCICESRVSLRLIAETFMLGICWES
jgi:hypothetical protein